jgi:hypothetical protein
LLAVVAGAARVLKIFLVVRVVRLVDLERVQHYQ